MTKQALAGIVTFLLLAVVASAQITVVERSDKSSDIAPVVGYSSPVSKKAILWDSQGRRYESGSGNRFSQVAKSGLPDSFVPVAGFAHDFQGGNEGVVDSAGNYYIKPTNASGFTSLNLNSISDGVIPTNFRPQLTYPHYFNDDSSGPGGYVSLLESLNQSFVWSNESSTFIDISNAWDQTPVPSQLPSLGYAYQVGDTPILHLWYENERGVPQVYEKKGNAGSWQQIYPSGIKGVMPDVAYFDHGQNKIVLWYGNVAYQSGTVYDAVPRFSNVVFTLNEVVPTAPIAIQTQLQPNAIAPSLGEKANLSVTSPAKPGLTCTARNLTTGQSLGSRTWYNLDLNNNGQVGDAFDVDLSKRADINGDGVSGNAVDIQLMNTYGPIGTTVAWHNLSPSSTSTYEISCTDGTSRIYTKATKQLTVEAEKLFETVSQGISVSPADSTISSGSSITFRVTNPGNGTCSAYRLNGDDRGPKIEGGPRSWTVSPTSTTRYEVTCQPGSQNGVVIIYEPAQVKVNVGGINPDPPIDNDEPSVNIWSEDRGPSGDKPRLIRLKWEAKPTEGFSIHSCVGRITDPSSYAAGYDFTKGSNVSGGPTNGSLETSLNVSTTFKYECTFTGQNTGLGGIIKTDQETVNVNKPNNPPEDPEPPQTFYCKPGKPGFRFLGFNLGGSDPECKEVDRDRAQYENTYESYGACYADCVEGGGSSDPEPPDEEDKPEDPPDYCRFIRFLPGCRPAPPEPEDAEITITSIAPDPAEEFGQVEVEWTTKILPNRTGLGNITIEVSTPGGDLIEAKSDNDGEEEVSVYENGEHQVRVYATFQGELVEDSDSFQVDVDESLIDTDGDGIPDSEDEDDDGDGIKDEDDKNPKDPDVPGEDGGPDLCQKFGGVDCPTPPTDPPLPPQNPNPPTAPECPYYGLSFADVVDCLRNFRYTQIPQFDFRSWATENERLRCGYNNLTHSCTLGSGPGDRRDIIRAMIATQCVQPDLRHINIRTAKGMLDSIKSSTDNNYPVPLDISFRNQSAIGLGFHALIALDVYYFDNNSYSIKVLDPNDSMVEVFNCSTKTNFPWLSQEGQDIILDTIVCNSPRYGDIVFYYSQENVNMSFLLQSAHRNICGDSPLNAFCRERYNMTNWLELNYPEIDNASFVTDNGYASTGICYGWTDFVLRVAYLGGFGSADIHNNKIQPEPTTLEKVLSPFQNFFDRIRN